MKRKNFVFLKYILVLLLAVFLGLSLLILSSFAPQGRILDNLWDSMDMLHFEGVYPHMADYSDASRLDNFTDVLMLLESAGTNDQYLGSVLTNPVYIYEEAGADVVELLECYLNGMAHDSVGYYVRYWMGFRVLLRIGLSFLNYFQLRRYLAFGFFLLLAAVMCSIAKRVDPKLAFLFAASVALVRPYVIVNSMQYCCCFYIMMLAMLLVPRVYQRPKGEGLFFFTIGIVTMYFDFYTVPLITVGFPLVYLFALRRKDGGTLTGKAICRDLLLWLAGYGLMWLAKLTLTSILTDVDALGNGLQALLGRLGVEKTTGLEEYYSFSLAVERLGDAIFCDGKGKALFLMGLAICILVTGIVAKHRKIAVTKAGNLLPLLLLAALPFVWFLVTIQPLAMHHYFQYRTIALTYWAVGTFGYFLLERKSVA